MQTAIVLERVDGTGTDPSCHWVVRYPHKVHEGSIFISDPPPVTNPKITVATEDPKQTHVDRWEIECYEIILGMDDTKRLVEGLLSQRLEKYLQLVLHGAFKKDGGRCLAVLEGEP